MREFIDITEGWTADRKPKKYIAQGTADTIGDGLWSDVAMDNLKVKILPSGGGIQGGGNVWPKDLMGQINVYFDPSVWDTDRHGLIYTDSKFESDVKRLLKAAGFKHFDAIGYSEQGMQGSNYVNFDVDDKLAHELDSKGFITIVSEEGY